MEKATPRVPRSMVTEQTLGPILQRFGLTIDRIMVDDRGVAITASWAKPQATPAVKLDELPRAASDPRDRHLDLNFYQQRDRLERGEVEGLPVGGPGAGVVRTV